MLEGGRYRSSVFCGGGKYHRNGRENRGGLSGLRDWKGHYLETCTSSSCVPSRQPDVNDLRSVDDVIAYTSYPHSDFVNKCEKLQSKDQHDTTGSVNVLETGQSSAQENSLGSIDWKPLRWTHSGSLSSRGSGFSQFSVSSFAVDIVEAKTDFQSRNATTVQPPSGDAAPCPTFVASSEDTSSRKKQRLGWGEGLAKYEKKNVGVPDEGVSKNRESVHSPGSNLAVRSPGVIGFPNCTSPVTPSSVAYSSSPGAEDQPFIKAFNVGNDTSSLFHSQGSVLQHHLEQQHPINLENLELNSIANLSSSITELLQSDDPSSVDSTVVRSTAIDKLLIWKGVILKALEMTESKIDQLENELKLLNSESGSVCSCAALSSSLPAEGKAKLCEEQVAASNLISRSTPLQSFSGNIFVGTMNDSGGAQEEVDAAMKDDNIDSPRTATSKFVEPLALGDAAIPCNVVKHVECFGDLDASRSKIVEADQSNAETVVYEGAWKFTDTKTAGLRCGDVSLRADGGDMICDILTFNKDVANQSSEIFNKLLPKDECEINVFEASKLSSRQNESLIKEKFVAKKRFLRFKERAVSLKFCTFLRLWKEDMHFLSTRKYRSKPQKKIELSSRMPHIGYQKHPFSICSRASSPGNSLASKLLMDTQGKPYRNSLRMPALILDKKEKMVYRFISSNGLVEDPCAVEKDRALINPWTSEEKETLMDKLAILGKDFRKIASFLDHKTTADCIEFYYKNHKSDCFAKTKKKLECRKQGKSLASNTYLLTSGKKWNRDLNAVSLDMLGAASVLAGHVDESTDRQRTYSGRFLREYSNSKILCSDERSTNFSIDGNDKDAAAADVLAGICGSLSSEMMSSCIRSSVDPGESYQEWKYQKFGSVTKPSCTPEVMQKVDDETCSDESCGEMESADWTDEEKFTFIQAMSSYGKDFAMISRCVRTRSRDQCKVFFSKARKCLELDLIHSVRGTEGTPPSDDDNGSGNVAEDACALESGSVSCRDKSGSRIDVNVTSSVFSVNNDESDPGGNMDLQTDLNTYEEKNWPGNTEFEDSKCIEDLIPDECQADDKPKQILVDDTEVVADVSVDGHGTELDGEKMLLPKNNLNDRWGENEESDANSCGQAAFCYSLRKSKSVGDTPHLVADLGDSCSSRGFLEYKPNNFSELDCTVKSPVVSLKQGTPLLIANAGDCNLAAIHYERMSNQYVSSSKFGFEEMGKKQCKENSASTNNSQRHKPEHPSVDHVESSQILRGYPLHVPIKKEITGDIIFKRPPAFATLQKVEWNIPFDYPALECYLQRCNGSKSHCTAAEMHLLSRNLEHNSDCQRAHARSLSDTEKPSRNGDLKLFSQILTDPSSLPKEYVSTNENESVGTHEPKMSGKSFNLKFTGHHNVEGDSSSLKFDQNKYPDLENFPVRSYGFWDGNRIQTGLSSLPDSAILQAKYPAAFRNLPAPVSELEQQPLPAVLGSAGQNLNVIPFYSKGNQ